jgi:hypothetical protein
MSVDGAAIVAQAQKELGKPYIYGAEGPSAFDCSGLVQNVFNALGLKVPRVSSEQFGAGTQIQYADLQPGDLVFSEWSGDDVPHHGHVAIYAGNGQIIEAPHPGAVVHQVALDQDYLSHVDGYVRVNGVGSTSGTAAPAAGATGATGAGGPTAQPADLFGIGGFLGNLFGLGGGVSAISDLVGKLYDSVVGAFNFFSAFFRPSTYIRIGAGLAGVAFLITGLIFLGREAKGA